MMTHAAWLLLIPAAVAIGWLLGRRGGEIKGGAKISRLSNTYFRGLNYLLNEQQDKALEIFLQIAEVDKDTVETQFALGHLFRRRGEVDRAIRLHQNLVARTGLSEEQKTRAALELGEDYMRAGLLDRAETLFNDLVQMGVHAPKALQQLISIYQAERDWPQAIAHALKYEQISGEPMGESVAHYYCEMAEKHLHDGNPKAARDQIALAYSADSQCVRAGMIEGRLDLLEGNDTAAIRAFERVARHDVDFLPEVLPQLMECYERRGELLRARGFLQEVIERYAGVTPLLALTELIERDDGPAAAQEFLARQLLQRPSVRGEAALLEKAVAQPVGDANETLRTLKQITDQLLVRSANYRCGNCGFGARAHHWQCPSCKHWGSVKPLLNLLGS
ncbi:lipopolysaccharide assembly protein B [Arenimonas maotaiensis]|uniref:Lipopolysaccharide assembly protein B n=1 Tax=Arenimonas maotaiensis TaxID=1446479 RepID=A0A917CUA6_9GAMM|nr:lipopolysaccharide assembly protein LapB [Arenimonas maotaiensis]GGF97278.1 lipopolysaccharide assembly protein B [Arenimonas maotaiensis]